MVTKKDVRKELDHAGDRVRESGCAAMDELSSLTHSSCRYIKENPWAGVGLGAVVGLVVGALLSRK